MSSNKPTSDEEAQLQAFVKQHPVLARLLMPHVKNECASLSEKTAIAEEGFLGVNRIGRMLTLWKSSENRLAHFQDLERIGINEISDYRRMIHFLREDFTINAEEYMRGNKVEKLNIRWDIVKKYKAVWNRISNTVLDHKLLSVWFKSWLMDKKTVVQPEKLLTRGRSTRNQNNIPDANNIVQNIDPAANHIDEDPADIEEEDQHNGVEQQRRHAEDQGNVPDDNLMQINDPAADNVAEVPNQADPAEKEVQNLHNNEEQLDGRNEEARDVVDILGGDADFMNTGHVVEGGYVQDFDQQHGMENGDNEVGDDGSEEVNFEVDPVQNKFDTDPNHRTVNIPKEDIEALGKGLIVSGKPAIPGIEIVRREMVHCLDNGTCSTVHTDHNPRSWMEQVRTKVEEAKQAVLAIIGPSQTQPINRIFETLSMNIHQIENPDTATPTRKRGCEEQNNSQCVVAVKKRCRRSSNSDEDEEERLKKECEDYERNQKKSHEEQLDFRHNLRHLDLVGTNNDADNSLKAVVHLLFAGRNLRRQLQKPSTEKVKQCIWQLFTEKNTSVSKLSRALGPAIQLSPVCLLEYLLNSSKGPEMYELTECGCYPRLYFASFGHLDINVNGSFCDIVAQTRLTEKCEKCLINEGSPNPWKTAGATHIFTVHRSNNCSFQNFKANDVVKMYDSRWALQSFMEVQEESDDPSRCNVQTWCRMKRESADSGWKKIGSDSEVIIDGKDLLLDDFSISALVFEQLF